MRWLIKKLAALCLAILALPGWGSTLVDQTFDAGSGPVDGSIAALALQPDGRLLVGGQFTTFAGKPCWGIVRLNGDGSLDGSFARGTSIEPDVRAILLLPDGDVLLGGEFKSAACRALLRLQPDGSVDRSFSCGLSHPELVTALALQSDGKILAGTLEGVERLLPDGQPDRAFAGGWSNTVVAVIATQPDGRIVAGGPPGRYSVRPGSLGLVRLEPNGALDPTFQHRLLDQRAADGVTLVEATSLLLKPDGKILVGGLFFVEWDPFNNPNLLSFNADGSLDKSFGIHASGAAQHTGLLARPDGRVMISSGGMSIDGVPRPGIAQLLPSGELDLGFSADFGVLPPPYAPASAYPNAMVLQPDGKVIAGGFFTGVDGLPRAALVRLHDRGATNLSSLAVSLLSWGAESEADMSVTAVVVRAGEQGQRVTVDFLVEGESATPGQDFLPLHRSLVFEPGQREKRIQVQILDDMQVETNETLRVRLDNPGPGAVLAERSSQSLTILDDDGFHFGAEGYTVGESDEEVYLKLVPGHRGVEFAVGLESIQGTASAGKDFEDIHEVVQFSSGWQDAGHRVVPVPILDNAVVDGERSFAVTARNLSSGLPVGPNSTVRVTITDDDTHAGPAKGLTGTIHAGVALPDGRIVVGGWFTAVDGLRRRYVACLKSDGAVDRSFDPGPGPNAPVTALARQPDGRILIGGYFTQVSGAARDHFARLLPDGKLDEGFIPETNRRDPDPRWTSLRQVIVQPDGRILACGDFAEYDKELRGLVRWNADGSLDRSFDPRPDTAGNVDAMALQADGRMVVGMSDDAQFRRVIRLRPDGSVDTQFQPFSASTLGRITSLLVLQDGGILVGSITSSIYDHGFIRLNADGAVSAGYNGKVFFMEQAMALVELPDGKVLAGGAFGDHYPYPSSGLIRLTPDGSLDPTFLRSNHTNERLLVRSLVLQAGGAIFAGGTFAGYDAETVATDRRHPAFGVSYSRRSPTAYYWMRFGPNGNPMNDLRFERIVLVGDGEVHVSMTGQAQSAFRLEASEDLMKWSVVTSNRAPNAGLVFRDVDATFSKRYYRGR